MPRATCETISDTPSDYSGEEKLFKPDTLTLTDEKLDSAQLQQEQNLLLQKLKELKTFLVISKYDKGYEFKLEQKIARYKKSVADYQVRFDNASKIQYQSAIEGYKKIIDNYRDKQTECEKELTLIKQATKRISEIIEEFGTEQEILDRIKKIDLQIESLSQANKN